MYLLAKCIIFFYGGSRKGERDAGERERETEETAVRNNRKPSLLQLVIEHNYIEKDAYTWTDVATVALIALTLVVI